MPQRLVLTIAALALPFAVPAQHRHDLPALSAAEDTMVSAPTVPARTAADSARVAGSLLKACLVHIGHSRAAYLSCLSGGISALAAAGNIALAMGTLDAVINSDAALIPNGHPFAHSLGFAIRSTPQTVSALLSQCDERYQSGCYHGILQRYFDTRAGSPLAQAVLVAPCEKFRDPAQQFRLFDCLHGTGHGLMIYRRYDVRSALSDCDRLEGHWDQTSCYGGVFMEHNMGIRMQSARGHASGHDHHPRPPSNIVLFKPDDLHYPCNATPERYRRECYFLQADLILPAVRQDYAKAAKVCDGAPSPELIRACYLGLGRNASGAAVFSFPGIRQRCDKSSESGRPFCYEGAVRHLAYAPGELSRGLAFCRSLPDGPVRQRCWGGLGLQISGFFADPDARRRACDSDRASDVAECTNGAGVPGRRGTIGS